MVKIEINISIPKINSWDQRQWSHLLHGQILLSISSNSQEFLLMILCPQSLHLLKLFILPHVNLIWSPQYQELSSIFIIKWHSPWTFLSWIEIYWWSKPSGMTDRRMNEEIEIHFTLFLHFTGLIPSYLLFLFRT